MNDQIPQRLSDAITSTPSGLRGDSRYVYASCLLIAEFLRKDPLVLIKQTVDSGYKFTVRLNYIADIIFSLRKTSGFIEICRRMSSRDFTSSFHEARSAKIFSDNNYDIIVKQETGKRGSDFDFVASNGKYDINVEATSITNQEYRPETLANVLHHKRKQLPTGAASVIVCSYPEAWDVGVGGATSDMRRVIDNFLRGTKRVNAIVCITERHKDLYGDGSVGGLFSFQQSFLNASQRIPCDLNFLLNANPERSEYFEWVDSIIDSTTE